MSLVLEMSRTLRRAVRRTAAQPQPLTRWRPFSGVLELLKALEETLDLHDVGVPSHPNEGTES